MTMGTTRRLVAALACTLSGLAAAPAHAAPSTQAGVYDGYDAFYDALPDRLFDRLDARPMTAIGGDPDHPRAGWSGDVPGVKGEHKIELRETTPVIDGRSMFARPESIFPGALSMALGDRAKLYVNERALCFEGQPAADGSGGADHDVQVTLVLLPFKEKTARRYELPRLFASCLGITQQDGQPVAFLAATLRKAPGLDVAEGVDFAAWTIGADGNFHRGTGGVRTIFVDPANVSRFRADAAAAP